MKPFLVFSACSGFIAVALGAFGAHALKGTLDAYHLSVFRTGVDYQFYHVFALALVAWLTTRYAELPTLVWSGWLFMFGTIVFSGSLYALALTQIKMWGAVTPVGGMAFLAGWALLAFSVATAKS